MGLPDSIATQQWEWLLGAFVNAVLLRKNDRDQHKLCREETNQISFFKEESLKNFVLLYFFKEFCCTSTKRE